MTTGIPSTQHFVDPSIRKDMIDTVKYKLSGANDQGLNTWNVDGYDRTYDYETAEQNVKAVGVFIHSNGSMKTGNDEVHISFIQFSGVSAGNFALESEQLIDTFHRFSTWKIILGSLFHKYVNRVAKCNPTYLL